MSEIVNTWPLLQPNTSRVVYKHHKSALLFDNDNIEKKDYVVMAAATDDDYTALQRLN